MNYISSRVEQVMKLKVREDAKERLKDQVPTMIFFQVFFYAVIYADAWAYQSGTVHEFVHLNQHIAEDFKWILIGHPIEFANSLLYFLFPLFLLLFILIIVSISVGSIIDSVFFYTKVNGS